MKYTYDGIDNNEIIRNYRIENNKIIVTYLDNSINEAPYSEYQEKKIIDKMIGQAIDRDNSDALDDAINIKNYSLYAGICMTLITSCSCYGATIDNNYFNKIFFIVLAIITGASIIIDGKLFNRNKSEVEELKKYRLYLSMRKKIEELIAENKMENISINTLDNYSLKDIEKLRKSLG